LGVDKLKGWWRPRRISRTSDDAYALDSAGFNSNVQLTSVLAPLPAIYRHRS